MEEKKRNEQRETVNHMQSLVGALCEVMTVENHLVCIGRLSHADNRELTLGEGLNIIQAPNEGGKSTWSVFLRAMLYGVNTKERVQTADLSLGRCALGNGGLHLRQRAYKVAV